MVSAHRHDPRIAAFGLVALAAAIFSAYFWLRPDTQKLPDFSSIDDIELRKAAFFDYLAPIVINANHRILAQRERLIQLSTEAENASLGPLQRRWLARLAKTYELEWPGDSIEQTLEALLERVDIVPVSLALTQAAKESGWGQSRFALEGNNLFGHWCYEEGCGIVPADRAAGATHEVAAFDSVTQSVRRYINNLNTHPSYQPLRDLRAAQRAAGERPTGLALADGLSRYSERRDAYVQDIKQILKANRALIDQALDHANNPYAGRVDAS
jgi:Bax protein